MFGTSRLGDRKMKCKTVSLKNNNGAPVYLKSYKPSLDEPQTDYCKLCIKDSEGIDDSYKNYSRNFILVLCVLLLLGIIAIAMIFNIYIFYLQFQI